MKWKVPFKRTPPKPGHAHFVIAYKTETGERMEFDGQLPKELARELMLAACSKGKSIK